MTGISGKPIKILQNSGILQDFESIGSRILQKLQLSFLEMLKFLGIQFGVVHGGGGGEEGGGIFSGKAQSRLWTLQQCKLSG